MGSHLVVISVALGQIALAKDDVLAQYTAEAADWEDILLDEEKYDDHSVTAYVEQRRKELGDEADEWEANLKWDGNTIKPTDYPFDKQAFYEAMCPDRVMVRGLQDLYDEKKPFKDEKNPTKAEVDHWHMLGINHIRALVGYTEPKRQVKPDVCLHLRALWSDENKSGQRSKAPCGEVCNTGHCGASCVPNSEDQQEYLNAQREKNTGIYDSAGSDCPADICEIDECKKKAGAEGILGWSTELPWGVRFSETFCSVLRYEGFWGGHVGPWFSRSLFGWNWWYEKPDLLGMRGKWGGKKLSTKYKNPASGEFLMVNGVPARFQSFQCDATIFFVGVHSDQIPKNESRSATDCYNLMMEQIESQDSKCGGRYVTHYPNDGNCGCISSTSDCKGFEGGGNRNTFDMYEPRGPSSIGGFIIDEDTTSSGKLGVECKNENFEVVYEAFEKSGWKETGDAWDCLKAALQSTECGNEGIDDWEDRNIVWNSINKGCGCYKRNAESEDAEPEECDGMKSIGRKSYRIRKDCNKPFLPPYYYQETKKCDCPPETPRATYGPNGFEECVECNPSAPYFVREERACIECSGMKKFDEDKLICKCPVDTPYLNPYFTDDCKACTGKVCKDCSEDCKGCTGDDCEDCTNNCKACLTDTECEACPPECEACPGKFDSFDEDLGICLCPKKRPYVEEGKKKTKCEKKCSEANKYFVEEVEDGTDSVTKKCVEECPDDQPFYVKEKDENDKYYKKCVNKCPKDLEFLTFDQQCVSQCNLYFVKKEDGTKKCVKRCPDNYEEQTRLTLIYRKDGKKCEDTPCLCNGVDCEPGVMGETEEEKECQVMCPWTGKPKEDGKPCGECVTQNGKVCPED